MITLDKKNVKLKDLISIKKGGSTFKVVWLSEDGRFGIALDSKNKRKPFAVKDIVE
jgi:hypothetical protein